MKKTFAKATLFAALAMTPSLLLGQTQSGGVENMDDLPTSQTQAKDSQVTPDDIGQVAAIELEPAEKDGYTINAEITPMYLKKEKEAANISDAQWIALVHTISQKMRSVWPEIVAAASLDDLSAEQITSHLNTILRDKLKPFFDGIQTNNKISFASGFDIKPILNVPLSACTNDGFREKALIALRLKGAGKAPDAQGTQHRLEAVWSAMVTKIPHTDFAFDKNEEAPTNTLQQAFKDEIGPILDLIRESAGNIPVVGFDYAPPVADATCKAGPS